MQTNNNCLDGRSQQTQLSTVPQRSVVSNSKQTATVHRAASHMWSIKTERGSLSLILELPTTKRCKWELELDEAHTQKQSQTLKTKTETFRLWLIFYVMLLYIFISNIICPQMQQCPCLNQFKKATKLLYQPTRLFCQPTRAHSHLQRGK